MPQTTYKTTTGQGGRVQSGSRVRHLVRRKVAPPLRSVRAARPHSRRRRTPSKNNKPDAVMQIRALEPSIITPATLRSVAGVGLPGAKGSPQKPRKGHMVPSGRRLIIVWDNDAEAVGKVHLRSMRASRLGWFVGTCTRRPLSQVVERRWSFKRSCDQSARLELGGDAGLRRGRGIFALSMDLCCDAPHITSQSG